MTNQQYLRKLLRQIIEDEKKIAILQQSADKHHQAWKEKIIEALGCTDDEDERIALYTIHDMSFKILGEDIHDIIKDGILVMELASKDFQGRYPKSTKTAVKNLTNGAQMAFDLLKLLGEPYLCKKDKKWELRFKLS